MNIIYFMACDTDLLPIIKIIKAFIRLLQLAIPIALILYGMIDLGKAVISSKEDEMKAAQKMLVKRVIYAVAVFLVVSIVSLVMSTVANNSDDSAANNWKTCWNKA